MTDRAQRLDDIQVDIECDADPRTMSEHMQWLLAEVRTLDELTTRLDTIRQELLVDNAVLASEATTQRTNRARDLQAHLATIKERNRYKTALRRLLDFDTNECWPWELQDVAERALGAAT